MTLELRQLRYFIAVAEERHFGRGAARLGIAQPGLSQQIKRLERSIGVQLLVRDKRHVELTAAGEVLLDQGRLAIEFADRALGNARSASDGRVGVLKIGAYATGILPVANELLREFESRFPRVEVELHPGHARQSVDALTRRAIDVTIVFSPFDAPIDVQCHPLGMLEAVAAVPSAHRLAKLDRIPRSELLDETIFIWPRDLNPPLVDHMLASSFGGAEHRRLVEVI